MEMEDSLFECLDGIRMNKQQHERLAQRFAEMTVRERLTFPGAVSLSAPGTASDAMRIAGQLYRFSLLYGAKDFPSLGRYYMDYISAVPRTALPYLNAEDVGLTYRMSVHGSFTGGHFIREDQEVDFSHAPEHCCIPSEEIYAIRVKLASQNNPDGVWVGFPDFGETTAGTYPDELRLGLDALGVKTPGECTVLDVTCALPQLEDIPGQYDSAEKLLFHAINLGYAWEEQCQGTPCFEAKLQAVLELEGVHRLDEALDYAQNLSCYRFIPKEDCREFGIQQAAEDGIVFPSDIIVKKCFNGEAYAGDYAKRHGMSATDHGLVAWNGQELHFEFSRQDQGPQMTM